MSLSLLSGLCFFGTAWSCQGCADVGRGEANVPARDNNPTGNTFGNEFSRSDSICEEPADLRFVAMEGRS
jgi:hypothetical protein